MKKLMTLLTPRLALSLPWLLPYERWQKTQERGGQDFSQSPKQGD
jgi:hypothetical protein